MPAWFWRRRPSVGGLQPLQFWQMFDNPGGTGRQGFRPTGGSRRTGILHGVAHRKPFGRGARREIPRRKTADPPDVLREMTACADRAVAEAEKARAAGPANAPYLKDIVASAYLNRTLCQRNAALVEAALFFTRAGMFTTTNTNYRANGPYRRSEYGAECIAALERAIQRDYLMRRIMLDYSPAPPHACATPTPTPPKEGHRRAETRDRHRRPQRNGIRSPAPHDRGEIGIFHHLSRNLLHIESARNP